MDLAEAGVISNAKKTLHPGKFISTMMMGTQRLYDFVNNNPDVELYPGDYSNHPNTIAKNDNMVSINSAIQVDLMGQINAETIGPRQFSGIGGQVDYIRGTALAKNGRSVIAMPSATKGISKIVARLDDGSVVTTSRCAADYVVPEYGVAKLREKPFVSVRAPLFPSPIPTSAGADARVRIQVSGALLTEGSLAGKMRRFQFQMKPADKPV